MLEAVSSVVEREGLAGELTNSRVFSTKGTFGWLCLWCQGTIAEATPREHGS
jgi:hypothetical protein